MIVVAVIELASAVSTPGVAALLEPRYEILPFGKSEEQAAFNDLLGTRRWREVRRADVG